MQAERAKLRVVGGGGQRLLGHPPVRRALKVVGAALGCLLIPVGTHAAVWVTSVEYVEITLADNVLSASANLTKSQNTAACVPFASMMVAGVDQNYEQSFTDVFFETVPTRVTVQRGAGAAGTSVTVGVFVVEFDPAYVNVQQGTFAMANGDLATTVGPISQVDLTKAALVFYHHNPTAVDLENFAIAGYFSADNQLTFQRSGNRRAVNGHYYVFEARNSEFSVQTVSFGIPVGVIIGSSNTATIASVDPAKTFVIASHRGQNATDDPSETNLGIWLSDPTTITARRQWQNIPPPPDNTIDDIRVFVVSSNDILVQRGTLDYGKVLLEQTASLTQPVNTSLSMVWNGSSLGPGAIETNSTGGATAMWPSRSSPSPVPPPLRATGARATPPGAMASASSRSSTGPWPRRR